MSSSLFTKIGGTELIEDAVNHYFEIICRDPELSAGYAGVDIEHLKPKYVGFLSTAMGGPGDTGVSFGEAQCRMARAGANDNVIELAENALVQGFRDAGLGVDLLVQVEAMLRFMSNELVASRESGKVLTN